MKEYTLEEMHSWECFLSYINFQFEMDTIMELFSIEASTKNFSREK